MDKKLSKNKKCGQLLVSQKVIHSSTCLYLFIFAYKYLFRVYLPFFVNKNTFLHKSYPLIHQKSRVIHNLILKVIILGGFGIAKNILMWITFVDNFLEYSCFIQYFMHRLVQLCIRVFGYYTLVCGGIIDTVLAGSVMPSGKSSIPSYTTPCLALYVSWRISFESTF
mgnify:CR=1 FL=1